MSIENVPDAPKGAAALWLTRSGPGGKLLAAGGAIGVVAVFLPLVSVSMQMMGMMGASRTVAVIDTWQGKVSLVGYIAALAFAWLLFPPASRPAKELCWASIATGAVVALLGLWLLVNAFRFGGGGDLMGMGSINASIGIGGVVNALAGAAVLVGALLKGREERLF